MSTNSEATLTECYILTLNTLIDNLILFNFAKLTAITVVIKLLSDLLTVKKFKMLTLFVTHFLNNIRCFFITTKWTFDSAILFDFMFSPLSETVQMESIVADRSACNSSVTFDNLHMTNNTQILIVIIFLLLLLHNYITSCFYIFEEVTDLV